jgi:uncharacterized membrane protein YeaQ/YmgE (transglycosylase-associated protein family)
MALIIIFAIGLIVGALGALVLSPRGHRHLYIHAATSVVGAMLGGILIARLVGGGPYVPNRLDSMAALWSVAGAISFLLGSEAFRRVIAPRGGKRP